jgi:hypothetical protein
MNLPEVLRRVRCRSCRWHEVWGPEEMLQVLRRRGMLRREKDAQLALIVQLFEQAASQLICPDCQHIGLEVAVWTPDFDLATRRACEVCGVWIPDERLELFPKATRCAACQNLPAVADDESGYCPRCGALVQVRPDRSGGISRYRATCAECGWKR